MHIKGETNIDHGVHWKISFNNEEVTIIAHNPKTGKRKVCEYECSFNYRDGYKNEDILEIYRILDSFLEALRE